MSDGSHSYIGVRSCGCRVAAVVDYGDAFTRKSVADFMRKGLVIERTTSADARLTLAPCKCAKADPNPSLFVNAAPEPQGGGR